MIREPSASDSPREMGRRGDDHSRPGTDLEPRPDPRRYGEWYTGWVKYELIAGVAFPAQAVRSSHPPDYLPLDPGATSVPAGAGPGWGSRAIRAIDRGWIHHLCSDRRRLHVRSRRCSCFGSCNTDTRNACKLPVMSERRELTRSMRPTTLSSPEYGSTTAHTRCRSSLVRHCS